LLLDFPLRIKLESVLEKDILNNNTEKSQALFHQAFEIFSSLPAQETSFTKLLGQLQDKGNTDLIKHYIKLYEGAFLEKFSGTIGVLVTPENDSIFESSPLAFLKRFE